MTFESVGLSPLTKYNIATRKPDHMIKSRIFKTMADG